EQPDVADDADVEQHGVGTEAPVGRGVLGLRAELEAGDDHQGVCVERRTRAKTPGTTSSRAMPYRIRDWVIRATRQVLATAISAMRANSQVGRSSGPCRTTSSSAPSDPA